MNTISNLVSSQYLYSHLETLSPIISHVVKTALPIILAVGAILLTHYYFNRNKSQSIVFPQECRALQLTTTDYQPQIPIPIVPVIPKLDNDVLTHILTFLGRKDILDLRLTSTLFSQPCVSPAIMRGEQFLGNPNLRIWGGTNCILNYVKGKGFHYLVNTPELMENSVKESLSNPFQVFKKYKDLKENKEIDTEFLDYIARLMNGGPIAFSNIVRKDDIDPSCLQPNDMGDNSIIRGKLGERELFLALRVLDRNLEDKTPKVLVFKTTPKPVTQSNQSSMKIFKTNGIWTQVANDYWNKDELKVANSGCLNYILAIINRKDHSEQDSKVYKDSVYLV